MRGVRRRAAEARRVGRRGGVVVVSLEDEEEDDGEMALARSVGRRVRETVGIEEWGLTFSEHDAVRCSRALGADKHPISPSNNQTHHDKRVERKNTSNEV